jgi:hypothetical protein
MDEEFMNLVNEYNSITKRMINVKMGDKVFIDTELRDKKRNIGLDIMDKAIKVINRQIQIAGKYYVSHPYDHRMVARGFFGEVIQIYQNRILINCVDTVYDAPQEFEVSIKFEAIANFDENEYAIKCLEKRIQSQKDKIRSAEQDINEANQKITEAERKINELNDMKISLINKDQ